MKQKGFISILILIVVIITISTIITGVVLYKTGKLNLDANISESIKKNAEPVQQEEPKVEFGEPQPEQEQILEKEKKESEQESEQKPKSQVPLKVIAQSDSQATPQPEFKPDPEQEKPNGDEELSLQEQLVNLQEQLDRLTGVSTEALRELPENFFHQPRLILYQDNLGNTFKEGDLERSAGDLIGFVSGSSPACFFTSSQENDCYNETLEWINNRSIEIGNILNITLDSFDADEDDVFYNIDYGSRSDYTYGTMRNLQSWDTNSDFSIKITEQLFNETFKERNGWDTHIFDSESRKHYNKNISLINAGELNIEICFNDKKETMEYPRGKQFTNGCTRFKYFILKPGHSDLTTI